LKVVRSKKRYSLFKIFIRYLLIMGTARASKLSKLPHDNKNRYIYVEAKAGKRISHYLIGD
jgi:hypothetical protein